MDSASLSAKGGALVKVAAAVGVAAIGRFPVSLVFLFAVLSLDYMTGVAAAFVERKASSEVGGRGLVKKTMVLALALMVFVLERFASPEIHAALPAAAQGFSFAAGVATYYSINEMISIIENCARCGVPIPSAIVGALKNAKKLGGATASKADLAELAGEQPKVREAAAGE